MNFTEDIETIRVTCGGLARISVDNKLLFIINRNSVLSGKPEFGPLGGALEFDNIAAAYLSGLGAKFEKPNDLRFILPVENLQQCIEWFETRENRETTSMREVYEELCDENFVVTGDALTGTEEFYRTVYEEKLTKRIGQEGVKTQAMFEIFNVVLGDAAVEQIKAYILYEVKNPLVILVEPDMVLTDTRLAGHCKHII